MNYRHAFHAGNFADVMKHAVLARLVAHLLKKDAPFRYVDTHAGLGLYDLAAEEAGKTLEWQGGVGRLEAPLPDQAEALLAPYRAALAAIRERHGPASYPGSPGLVREMLRPIDRAILVEKHPEDGEALSERFNQVRTMKVLQMDGWTALKSLIPPKERRGLVLIDPPYENPDELGRAPLRLIEAHRKWPTGMLVLWYPVKRSGDMDRALAPLAEIAGTLRLELILDRAGDPRRLNGSGLAIVNPPWTLAEESRVLLPAMAERLGVPGRAETIVRVLGAAR